MASSHDSEFDLPGLRTLKTFPQQDLLVKKVPLLWKSGINASCQIYTG